MGKKSNLGRIQKRSIYKKPKSKCSDGNLCLSPSKLQGLLNKLPCFGLNSKLIVTTIPRLERRQEQARAASPAGEVQNWHISSNLVVFEDDRCDVIVMAYRSGALPAADAKTLGKRAAQLWCHAKCVAMDPITVDPERSHANQVGLIE